ncbi:hypothetical protein GCM10027341_05130 [Spirosoma knui]
MSLIETVKKIFGLTPTSSDPPVEPVEKSPANVVVPKPAATGLPPTAQRRDQVLRFLLEKLRPYQNEPGATPTGLRLCIRCVNSEEEELYRVALWANQPGKFQAELSRQLADNYITLSKNWQFDYELFADELPAEAFREGNLGLIIFDESKPDTTPLLARIVTLVGQTDQDEYLLDPTMKDCYCIGRGRTSQTTSGRVRTNDIVILNEDENGFDPQRGANNAAVSRAHATIKYNKAQRQYSLVVDTGGLPASGNKTKIVHPNDRVERADIGGLNYPLQDGDQIELGGAVTLLFELQQ